MTTTTTTTTDRWELIEAGVHYDTITASSAKEALEIALDNFDRDLYDVDDTTEWIDITVRNVATGDAYSRTIAVHSDEPSCSEDEHDWRQVSVSGHGGGCIVREVCAHCGTYRVTDTWATNLATGEQGLTAISYEEV